MRRVCVVKCNIGGGGGSTMFATQSVRFICGALFGKMCGTELNIGEGGRALSTLRGHHQDRQPVKLGGGGCTLLTYFATWCCFIWRPSPTRWLRRSDQRKGGHLIKTRTNWSSIGSVRE